MPVYHRQQRAPAATTEEETDAAATAASAAFCDSAAVSGGDDGGGSQNSRSGVLVTSISPRRKRRSSFSVAAAVLLLVLSLATAASLLYLTSAAAGRTTVWNYYYGGASNDSNSSKAEEEKAPAGRTTKKKGDNGEDNQQQRTKQTDENESSSSSRLPEWMKEYFAWHRKERARLVAAGPDRWNSSNTNSTTSDGDDSDGQQRRAQTEFSFLVATCLRTDSTCGGTADRLRPLPFLVKLASETRRLLFVYWERPAPLESFLRPPQFLRHGGGGGVDWRLPDFLIDPVRNTQDFYKSQRALVDAAHAGVVLAAPSDESAAGTARNEQQQGQQQGRHIAIVRARAQIHDHGADYYNRDEMRRLVKEDDESGRLLEAEMRKHGRSEEQLRHFYFAYHFRDCFEAFFTPAPQLARRVADEMRRMRIRPGSYASAHVRANYALHGRGKERGRGFLDGGDEGRDPELVRAWTKNALNCLSTLRPGGPFFFAADSSLAKQIAVQYGKEKGVDVVTSQEQKNPLHIDIVPDWKTRDPSDYYDIWVDLLVMSMGRCLTWNVGGFGLFALHLSGQDKNCTKVHWTSGVPKSKAHENCIWQDPPPNFRATSHTEWKSLSADDLFVPPMP